MFYVCEVIGLIDDLTDSWYVCEKSLEMCICLWPEFGCPEVTLCGWQDIKIQLLLLLFCLSLLDDKHILYQILNADSRFMQNTMASDVCVCDDGEKSLWYSVIISLQISLKQSNESIHSMCKHCVLFTGQVIKHLSIDRCVSDHLAIWHICAFHTLTEGSFCYQTLQVVQVRVHADCHPSWQLSLLTHFGNHLHTPLSERGRFNFDWNAFRPVFCFCFAHMGFEHLHQMVLLCVKCAVFWELAPPLYEWTSSD